MDEEEKGGRVLHREAPPQQLSWDGITLPRKGVVRVQCPGGQVRLVVLEFGECSQIDRPKLHNSLIFNEVIA
jgi:hypothetical protein